MIEKVKQLFTPNTTDRVLYDSGFIKTREVLMVIIIILHVLGIILVCVNIDFIYNLNCNDYKEIMKDLWNLRLYGLTMDAFNKHGKRINSINTDTIRFEVLGSARFLELYIPEESWIKPTILSLILDIFRVFYKILLLLLLLFWNNNFSFTWAFWGLFILCIIISFIELDKIYSVIFSFILLCLFVFIVVKFKLIIPYEYENKSNSVFDINITI